MSVLTLVAAALVPGLYLRRVSLASLAVARDAWLVGLLIVGVGAIGWREPWLGILGGYLAWWWLAPPAWDPLRRERWEKARTVVAWGAVGATWFLALELPPWAWAWLPAIWGAWAWALAGAMAFQVLRRDPAKVRGWLGMRSVAGSMLALILPLLPLWAWPGPLIGLWLSGPSWVAVAALGAAGLVRWPNLAAWGLLAALAGLLALAVRRRVSVFGRAIGEWSPRGDSWDSLGQRGALLQWAWRHRSWAGSGPGTTPFLHLRAAARGELVEATGTLHNEPAQLAAEFGVAGIVAGLLYISRVGSRLEWGDPYSACVVAGCVLACGSMSLRVAPIGLIFLLACAEVAR